MKAEGKVERRPSEDAFEAAWRSYNANGNAGGWERVAFISGFGKGFTAGLEAHSPAPAPPELGNYVCDDDTFPNEATFSNGRIVKIAFREDGRPFLLISPKSEYPKPCGICAGVIQSKDDLDWHGYGNCRDIPDPIMNAPTPAPEANAPPAPDMRCAFEAQAKIWGLDVTPNPRGEIEPGKDYLYVRTNNEWITWQVAWRAAGAGGWVSVEERTPAPNSAVLFWTTSDCWESGYFRADENEPIRWVCERTGSCDEPIEFYEGQVTHWMVPASPVSRKED